MQYKNRKVDADEIFSFIEDMLRYLEKEEIEEHETNQNLTGTHELFRGFIVKAWKGVNFRTSKHKEVNKIVVIKCVEYHVKCWKIEMNACAMRIYNAQDYWSGVKIKRKEQRIAT